MLRWAPDWMKDRHNMVLIAAMLGCQISLLSKRKTSWATESTQTLKSLEILGSQDVPLCCNSIQILFMNLFLQNSAITVKKKEINGD